VQPSWKNARCLHGSLCRTSYPDSAQTGELTDVLFVLPLGSADSQSATSATEFVEDTLNIALFPTK
jgi:hypothetical protein